MLFHWFLIKKYVLITLSKNIIFCSFKAQMTKLDNEQKNYFGVTGQTDMLVKF